MPIGIDLGGTKIEAIALDENGATLLRHRVSTPTGDYVGTLNAIADLVLLSEWELCQKGSLGVASPGAISTRNGLLKNSNSTVLNGRPLVRDLSQRLDRPIRYPCAEGLHVQHEGGRRQPADPNGPRVVPVVPWRRDAGDRGRLPHLLGAARPRRPEPYPAT